MSHNRLLLIINPCAGQRKARRYLTEIVDIFNRGGWAVIVHVTAVQGDAARAVMQYADEVELVVCCGGDGTLNETVSGIMKSGKKLPVGYIPAGSTNDLASSLRLSSNILQATRNIVNGSAVLLDLGCFSGRYFSYVASFGAFTKTSYSTPQNQKNILGHAAYVLNGIQEISQLKTNHLRFELPDGEIIEDHFLFGAISNSRSVGGILTLAEDMVDLQDGQFELLLVRAPKDVAELAACVKSLQKQTYDCRMLTFLKTSSVFITAPDDMPWTLDGEREDAHEHIYAECLHCALNLIC